MGSSTRPPHKDTTVALFRPYERNDKSSSTDHISTLTPKGEKAAAKASGKPAAAAEPAVDTAATAAPKQVVRKKEGATPTRRAAEAARMERLHPTLTAKEQRKADAQSKSRARNEAWERDVMVTMNNVVVSSWISMSLWVLLGFTLINVGIMWRGFKKLLAERYPDASTRGLLVYMFNRSLMNRRFRQPAARINRGDAI